MTTTDALRRLQAGTGLNYAAEIQTLRVGLAVARQEAKKANKARGILEAILRDIHATSPVHKSQIECAWTAVNRIDCP